MFPHELCSRKTFQFHYMTPSALSMRLGGIGWQHVTSTEYRYDGLKRRDGEGTIFQFTLSGQGTIRHGDREYVVPKHCGFLCTLPSDHEYYYDEAYGPWEFLFIAVRGEDAIRHWNSLIDRFGPVVPFDEQLEPFLCISELYALIYRNAELDKYEVSARLYRFVLELNRISEGYGIVPYKDSPEPVRTAIRLMQTQYAAPLALDDIAASAGLSKYHFSRVFLNKTGIQPMHYLRKIRIEKASALLAQTNKTMEAIARETGFEGSNYFIRVFKSLVGMTPSQYRQSLGPETAHALRIEK
ncbi:AraC family transcriptional regulator [Paenibacillus ginsengarvi]|uniref:Helix-turn-helix domain-containing protein n=1 Tax=Paenibacillus ginsengarvi TaxID=400777 RepID=A0A3B0CB95_9BACL|nr:helix-turn-helix domain-containing protein [Paenibacillus ginsengarvi]RKN83755.1 helix-turn-helix domain-containing protein [Paenibacillus ginsengarvi]